jgi:hypothetical protein
MRKLLLLPLLVLAALAVMPAVSNPVAEKDVLAAMEMWKKAVMTRDRALFDKTLHADLAYGHSNGLVETKQQSTDHIVNSQVI